MPVSLVSQCSALKRLAPDERGQSLLETTAFLVVAVVMLGFMVNAAYYILSYYTINEAAAKAALYAGQGQNYISGESNLPSIASVQTSVNTGVDNLSVAQNGAKPIVALCSPPSAGSAPTCTSGSPSTDPEAGNDGVSAPKFQAVSVTVSYTVQPLVPLSLMGYSLPFSSAHTFTQTYYERAIE